MSSSTGQTIILVSLIALCGLVSFKAVRKVVDQAQAIPQTITAPTKAIGSTPPPLDKELAPHEPIQTTPKYPATYRVKEYELTELAKFDATALLLSTKEYPLTSQDKGFKRSLLSPYDFAIGWGAMSNPAVLNNFRYYQANRFFNFANFVRYSNQAAALKTDELVANVHIIPASRDVARALENIHTNQVVRLVGSLVEVRQIDNGRKSGVIWRSSLTRKDLGDGACELLYLKRLEWKTPDHTGYSLAPEPETPEQTAAKSTTP